MGERSAGCRRGFGGLVGLVCALATSAFGCAVPEHASEPTEGLADLSVLVALEAALAADGDWRAQRAGRLVAGKTRLTVRAGVGQPEFGHVAGLHYQKFWRQGRRGKSFAIRVVGKGGEVPLIAVYGPKERGELRRVGYAAGKGDPSVARLIVRAPFDGEYLVVVGERDVVATDVGRARGYLGNGDAASSTQALTGEGETCQCPCDAPTTCLNSELWTTTSEGPGRLLKDCGARGQRCVFDTLPHDGRAQCAPLAEPPSESPPWTPSEGCAAYRQQATCVRIDGCGWCADGRGSCREGNERGPTSACWPSNWYYPLDPREPAPTPPTPPTPPAPSPLPPPDLRTRRHGFIDVIICGALPPGASFFQAKWSYEDDEAGAVAVDDGWSFGSCQGLEERTGRPVYFWGRVAASWSGLNASDWSGPVEGHSLGDPNVNTAGPIGSDEGGGVVCFDCGE